VARVHHLYRVTLVTYVKHYHCEPPIIAEFDEYTGPPYFTEPGRERWVVLRPITATWTPHGGTPRMREGYPSCMCYGLTAHKAQGSTNRGYGVVHFGDKESAANGSYTMLSRMTRMSNLLIPGGCSYSRLSTALRTKAFEARVLEEGRLDTLCTRTEQWWAALPVRVEV